jgi:glycosyltransferase involved in cell wall biosynthesis
MNDERILLSIIIPVYNVENYIGKCLDSIVNDICSDNVEVIVVDDGSTDSSGDVVDSYAAKYLYIKVIHKENSGVAVARNIGIENARGEWLYFVDSDDWLADGAVDIICKRIGACNGEDVLLFDAYKDTDTGEAGWEHFKNERVFDDLGQLKGLQRGMLYFPLCGIKTGIPLAAPWDKVYRKQFIMDNNLRFPLELRVLDDMVFNMEVFGRARKVSYFKDKIYHYRYVQASITNCYNPKRVSLDMDVWNYIAAYIGSNNMEDDEMFKQAFYCRIIKSFSICCRLNFFNAGNKNSFLGKIKNVENVLNTEPYKSAFKNVKLKNAEWKLKIMILVGRIRSGFGVWLLHVAQNGVK